MIGKVYLDYLGLTKETATGEVFSHTFGEGKPIFEGSFEVKVDEEGMMNIKSLLKAKCIIEGSIAEQIPRGAIIDFRGRKFKVYRRDFKREKVFAVEQVGEEQQ